MGLREGGVLIEEKESFLAAGGKGRGLAIHPGEEGLPRADAKRKRGLALWKGNLIPRSGKGFGCLPHGRGKRTSR